MIGIIARLPMALVAEFSSRVEELGGGLVIFLIEIADLYVLWLMFHLYPIPGHGLFSYDFLLNL